MSVNRGYPPPSIVLSLCRRSQQDKILVIRNIAVSSSCPAACLLIATVGSCFTASCVLRLHSGIVKCKNCKGTLGRITAGSCKLPYFKLIPSESKGIFLEKRFRC
ncbi:hypothetical protein ABEB36_006019 [Hypothenemus hampei]|uniref:LITAF domain-containing protein n=1 Tax=Hypothenemus hampei TaxID=57062 RepID=A0ABD1F095_HYPHA